jgi:phage gpG-like protein
MRFSVSASAMKKIGIDAVRMMIDRTKKGIDIDGMPFAPYSPQYIKYKSEAGRVTDPVNLQFNGEMHRSMLVVATDNNANISYGDRQRALVALYHQTGNGQPQRKHFGFTSEQARRIMDMLTDAIRKAVNRDK